MELDVHHYSVGKLFKQYSFRIPDYQRKYSWKTQKEVKDFWNDFTAMIKSDQTSYFMGSVLLAKNASDQSRSTIIDGQQRIITFTLLMIALRDYVRTLVAESNEITGAYDAYIAELEPLIRYAQGGSWNSKIALQREDGEALDQLLFQPGINSHESSKIRKAYDYFADEIMRWVGNSKELGYRSLHTGLLERVSVVSILCPDELDAHILFESVNDRGLALTQSEQIKNYLLSRIRDIGAGGDTVKHSWENIEREVGTDSGKLDKFLLCHWNSTHAQKIAAKDLYRSFKSEVGQVDIPHKIEELLIEARLFRKLTQPSYQDWQNREIVDTLTELKILNVKQVYVLALALGRMFHENKVDTAKFLDLLRYLVNFTLLHQIIGGASANTVEREYSRLAEHVRSNPDSAQLIKIELSALSPGDKVLREKIVSGKKVYSEKICKYILTRIVQADYQGGELEFAEKEHHLEHIIPKKPSELLRADLEAAGIVHAEVFRQLGNLTLMLGKWNQEMSNKPFKDKLDHYRKSKLRINKELAKLDTFGTAEITKRQKSLAGKILEHWSLG